MTGRQRWAIDAAERTARTFVQGFLAVITIDAFTDLSASWLEMLGVGAMAGVYSVLTAFAAKPVGAKDSASLLPTGLDPPKRPAKPKR